MIEYTVKVNKCETKYWYLNGKLHREDGPAVEYPDGTKKWYRNGKCHREDGPAVEYPNGSKVWFLDGKNLTEQEFLKRTGKTNKNQEVIGCLKKLLDCLEEK